jgi:hypothetical protein
VRNGKDGLVVICMDMDSTGCAERFISSTYNCVYFMLGASKRRQTGYFSLISHPPPPFIFPISIFMIAMPAHCIIPLQLPTSGTYLLRYFHFSVILYLFTKQEIFQISVLHFPFERAREGKAVACLIHSTTIAAFVSVSCYVVIWLRLCECGKMIVCQIFSSFAIVRPNVGEDMFMREREVRMC